jgi:hypothetical protein
VAESWAQIPHEPRLLARMPTEMRTRALALLDQALALQPRHIPSLEAAASAQLTAKSWEAALDLLGRLAEAAETAASASRSGAAGSVSDDPEQRTGYLVAAGDVAMLKLGDLDGAMRYYRRALSVIPGHPSASAKIESLKELIARTNESADQGLATGQIPPPPPGSPPPSPGGSGTNTRPRAPVATLQGPPPPSRGMAAVPPGFVPGMQPLPGGPTPPKRTTDSQHRVPAAVSAPPAPAQPRSEPSVGDSVSIDVEVEDD